MKKIAMVLGAGRSQLNTINLCKKYGYEVLVVSIPGDFPGFLIADYVENVDVRDKELVYELAKKYEIDAILSAQLDEAVPTIAYVAQKMGLPGIKYEIAVAFQNKEKMRAKANAAGINNPLYFATNDINELQAYASQIGFPLIIKPVDSSASRGVSKVNSPKELLMAYEKAMSFSNIRKVIIEECIQGTGYSVDAITINGNVLNLDIGVKTDFCLDDKFITKDTIMIDADSAKNNSEMLKTLEANKLLIERMGLTQGITHAEYIVRDGEVYLVEIAARGGGVFISSDLVPLITGVDIEDIYVKQALGFDVSEKISIKKGCAAFLCYLLPSGTIVAIEGINQINSFPGVVKAFFDNVFVGMTVDEVAHKASRKGPILVTANSIEDCKRLFNEIKNTLNIVVLDKYGNKKGIIWD